jgi:hypothetical protein
MGDRGSHRAAVLQPWRATVLRIETAAHGGAERRTSFTEVDALEELAMNHMNQKRNFGQVACGSVKTPSARPIYDKAVGAVP